jgi:hypothetical protein
MSRKSNILSFTTYVVKSICSFDKNNNQIRLSNWNNNNPGSLSLSFETFGGNDYSYGWSTWKDILIVKNRINTVPPVDVNLIVGAVKITDLQEITDILTKSFIIEYSRRQEYKPLTDDEADIKSRLSNLNQKVIKNLPNLSLTQMTRLVKSFPTLDA